MLIPEIFPLLYSFLPAASSNCSRSELPSPNVGSVLLQMELGLVSLSEHSDVTMRGSHRCCLWKVCLQFRECWDTAMNSFSNFEGVPLTYLQWFWFSPSSACDREHSRSRPGLQSRSFRLCLCALWRLGSAQGFMFQWEPSACRFVSFFLFTEKRKSLIQREGNPDSLQVFFNCWSLCLTWRM